MKKINLGKLPFMYPMPMIIVGTLVDSKPNFMAVAWVTPVNFDPPLIGIALGKTHHTNTGIKENQSFSICVPDIDLVRRTDFVGIVSGKQVDKSDVFTVFFEEHNDIPLIAECPVCIQLKLERIIELPSNDFFIGSVVATYMDERCIHDGKPDMRRINPFTLSMPDNNYWEVGAFLGKAWSSGKEFKQRISGKTSDKPQPVKNTADEKIKPVKPRPDRSKSPKTSKKK
jgi:flavin reductase (DIM6/NTAB) family NADH-FMN oxidoreductase RutF